MTPLWLPSTGTLRYSPQLGRGGHLRRDGGSTLWWLIVDCDPELGRYLRHQYLLGHRRTRGLQAPLWGPHISVIRGETPPRPAAWRRLDGATVGFEYDPQVHEAQGYVWCPVRCPALLDLREELGLLREPQPALHLTIGNANG
ncbi:hypothetical protein K4L06_03520 [Lysobacter sp. BMK333-48F3]|uniref:hypothetical protein n=1 Tax=Lysobacter sp. BMK333-48F3 TaxID=2867962 RepID=UPI001C8B96CE|nr:hypothetical protein [Lysobacter sp. BMK333-48F3]MBX9400366.1 hypothetical protein [Lysobacter sp. BMK333-48F3]